MDNNSVNPSTRAQEAIAAAVDELKRRLEDLERRVAEIERSVTLKPGGSPTELPP